MNTNGNIQMAFICNQNWDKMYPTERGRFCDFCSKEVFDYTKLPKEDIHNLNKTENTDLCGRFTIEQIDDSIIKPIEFPRYIKFGTFVSSLFFIFTSKTSFSQSKNEIKIEQLDSKNSIKSDSITKTDCNKLCTSHDEEMVFETLPRRQNKKYYWSKRFPFIKRRPVFLGGKYF
ncbi:MAG: hypothetical protein ACRCVT_05290 [Leadbetterella sp.]